MENFPNHQQVLSIQHTHTQTIGSFKFDGF